MNNMEEIPTIHTRESPSQKETYEQGRLYGIHQIEKSILLHLENIQKARDWSVSLDYPYPESHAIWLGEEKILKLLKDKLEKIK
jgi:hypothetical protein